MPAFLPALMINGAWTGAGAAGDFAVTSLATGIEIARVPAATDAVVDRAVVAARRAFAPWRDAGPHARAALLRRACAIVDKRRDAIARVLTAEQGKPLDEARGEVAKVARTFEFYAGEAVRVLGVTIPNEETGFLSLVEKEPIGVAAAIAPWNYPVEPIGWKLGGGLAAGCTLVVKPSEWTPLSAVALLDRLVAAGLPPAWSTWCTAPSPSARRWCRNRTSTRSHAPAPSGSARTSSALWAGSSRCRSSSAATAR